MIQNPSNHCQVWNHWHTGCSTQRQSKIKSLLYSRYYVEACSERRSASPRLSVWTTQLRKNAAAVTIRWRHWVRFDWLGNWTPNSNFKPNPKPDYCLMFIEQSVVYLKVSNLQSEAVCEMRGSCEEFFASSTLFWNYSIHHSAWGLGCTPRDDQIELSVANG